MLEDHPDAPALGWNEQTRSHHLLSADLDRARVRRFESSDQPQQGSLAGAAWTKQGQELAPVQRKIHASHRDGSTESLGEARATNGGSAQDTALRSWTRKNAIGKAATKININAGMAACAKNPSEA